MPQPFGLRTVLLVVLAAALYLVGNDRVGLWDRDEPRYAQTSREMLNSNPPDWVVPRILGAPRTAKPVFIYWCQAASMRMFGDNEFAARLPSAIAMVLTLILLTTVVARAFGPQTALWTGLVFATSALTIAAAKMCITDSVLLLWIALAQLCLFAIYNGNRSWSTVLILWISIGLAGLTKGPVVLGVQLSTMAVLAMLDVGKDWRSLRAWISATHWWSYTRPLVGLLLLAIVVSPWLIALQIREPGFLKQTLLHDVFTRSIKPLEGHKGPPGFYLLTIWGTFFPWSLLLPTALTLGWRNRKEGPIRFALAAIIGPWFVWELIQTKLVHYLLPIFPALAFLVADAIVRCRRKDVDDMERPAMRIAAVFWAFGAIATGILPWLAARSFPLTAPLVAAMVAMSIIATIWAVVVYMMFARQRIVGAVLSMGIGMAILIAALYAFYLPNAQFLWLPRHVGRYLAENGATTPGDVVMIDFKEDSLPYYQGGTIRPWPSRDYPAVLTAGRPTWLVMTRGLYDRLPAEMKARLEIKTSFRGLAYADRGKILEVLVVKKRP